MATTPPAQSGHSAATAGRSSSAMAPPETAARSTSAREPAQSAEEHQHDEHEQQQQQQPAQKPEEEHFGAQILASMQTSSKRPGHQQTQAQQDQQQQPDSPSAAAGRRHYSTSTSAPGTSAPAPAVAGTSNSSSTNTTEAGSRAHVGNLLSTDVAPNAAANGSGNGDGGYLSDEHSFERDAHQQQHKYVPIDRAAAPSSSSRDPQVAPWHHRHDPHQLPAALPDHSSQMGSLPPPPTSASALLHQHNNPHALLDYPQQSHHLAGYSSHAGRSQSPSGSPAPTSSTAAQGPPAKRRRTTAGGSRASSATAPGKKRDAMSAELEGGADGAGAGDDTMQLDAADGSALNSPRDFLGERDSEEWNRQRKDNHKEVERRRRSNINAGIDQLRVLVPGCSKNKGGILQKAVEYIAELQEREQSYINKWALKEVLHEQALREISTDRDYWRKEAERLARAAGEPPPQGPPVQGNSSSRS